MTDTRILKRVGALLISALILVAPGVAQSTWQRTCGGTGSEWARSVRQTLDGGYILAGYTTSFGVEGADFYLVKTDSLGEMQWSHTYGGHGWEIAYSVQQTSDSGYAIAGCSNSFGTGLYEFYLVKTNNSGDTVWTRTFGTAHSAYATAVQQTRDGGYVLAGYTELDSPPGAIGYLVKTDPNGNQLWANTPDTQLVMAYSVQQTSDGGYILTGEAYSTQVQLQLTKTDSEANLMWSHAWGNSASGRSVEQTTDGGYIVGGFCTDVQNRAFLVRAKALGDTLWTRKYFIPNCGSYGYSARQTSDGGFVLAGETYTVNTSSMDVYLVKTDASGDTDWTRTWGGDSIDVALSVSQTSDGGYILAGGTMSFGAGDWDVYLIKTDVSGTSAVREEPVVQTCQRVVPLELRFNPGLFSTSTTLSYSLPGDPKFAHLEIRDITGRLVRSFAITNSALRIPHSLVWDGSDDRGQRLPSGCYFCALRVGTQTTRTKVLLER